MWRRLFLTGSVILASLALASPAPAAYLESAHLTVVQHAQKPTWNVRYLLCHTAPGRPRALISEFTYRQGAKNSTLQVWMWGGRRFSPRRNVAAVAAPGITRRRTGRISRNALAT